MSADSTLRAALYAVAAACRVARHVQRDLDRVRQITKDDRSPVTVADFAVQAAVCLALEDALGEILITGEEHARTLRQPEHAAVRKEVVDAVYLVKPDATEDEVLDAIDRCDHDASGGAYWTLDPVDGTKGFLRGQQYAIALAQIEAGAVTLGVMGCPNLPAEIDRPVDQPDPRGTIYAARAGSGSAQWAADAPHGDGHPIEANAAGSLTAIRVCESVEAAHSKHGDAQRVLEAVGLPVSDVRLDSQCKYALVARNQADAYLRMPTRKDYVEKIWDHAAGMLIAQEAGAVVTDITGAPLDFSCGPRLERNRGVACAAAGVHGPLVEAIQALGLAAAV
jgi:3'(2'), 5'-bisphosphate nucleotidase